MRDLAQVKHNPVVEAMVDILCNKTQNTDRGFYRVTVTYFLAKMASSMRVNIATKDRGDIPVNVYAMCFASSGYGKGHGVNIIEEALSKFKEKFMDDTFETISEDHLNKLASKRSAYSGDEHANEKEKLDKEFARAGAMPFTFDSGTSPAVKQLRQKLLLANCGSINLQIDEIGSNLLGNVEILNVFLELYDQGLVKQKLTKNTADNERGKEVDGKTPSNILLFGTPSKLLDGGQTEDQFYDFLETGYARRCIVGWGNKDLSNKTETPAQIYAKLTSKTNSAALIKLTNKFTKLADAKLHNFKITLEDKEAIELLTYRMKCELKAAEYAEHQDIEKAELSHRYFKVLKVAGVYAFIDQSLNITMEHLYSAIKLVEESGEAFESLMTREKTYVKLAKYIASSDIELTHADLFEALPFYKSGSGARNEMMMLAMAWGYKNNIMIKKTFSEGIEFFSGETLEETKLDEIIISYSDDFAFNFKPQRAPFIKLYKLTDLGHMGFCNHHFTKNHRSNTNVISGFNTIVIDVDKKDKVRLDTVKKLLSEYTFMTYTTKSHTDADNSFRLILPMKYVLHLDIEDYRNFMNNVLEWLPFTSDEAANQISKKWECNKGTHFYNEGDLIDPLRFIPKTSKNEMYKTGVEKLASLDNLERWFALKIASGNRNNQLIKFALAVADSGVSYQQVEETVIAFNAKLSNGLDESEIRSTILQTVAKRMSMTK